MDLVIATLSIILLAFVVQAWLRNLKSKKLPPGPQGLPLFGSLHLLGKLPHHDLHKLAQKYGSIMLMRLGLVSAVVISSPQAAELVLKTHDLVFASRPPHVFTKYMLYNQKDFVFSPYGLYWRNMRTMCTLELLSTTKINSFRSKRKEELDLLIQYLKEASLQHTAVDVSTKVSSLIVDMSCRMIFGKKYKDEEFDERGFKALIREVTRLGAVFNIGDYIPWLAPLDLQGLRKQMKAVSEIFDAFFEKIIDEHIESKNPNQAKDFVDVMINIMGSKETEYDVGRDNIKAIILDLLAAAVDNSATSIEWALSELLKHPKIMKKIQKELEEKVGMNKMIEESDLKRLEYLDMVIKETFRLHSAAPLLLPHESMEDCTINGFFIPKKTRIIVNAYAIGRDPTIWKDAEKFLPERFIGSSIDIRGHDFQLLPFGSGRRGCPGMQLGITVVKLVLAQLLHCFDWELPNDILPADLDMEEEFGLATSRANHLFAVPTYRLNF